MDPSSSSSAPPPPRASFASLPLELVKQIVAEVNKQDNERLSITRAAHGEPSVFGPRRPPVHEQKKRTTRINAGVDALWSYWYGRGVTALSCVSKALRSFALPYLVELSAPFAYAELPTGPMAGMVRRLDLRDVSEHDDVGVELLVTSAVALREIEGVTEVKLGSAICYALQCRYLDHANAAPAVLAHRAYAELAPRLKELHVRAHPEAGFVMAVNMITLPSVLRTLHVTDSDNPFADPADDFAELLSSSSVSELAFTDDQSDYGDDAPEFVHPTWLAGFAIPTLKTFRYSAGYPLPARFFDLIGAAFPHLEHLSLSITDRAVVDRPIDWTRGLSPQDLPHLRTLSLDGCVATSPAFVHEVLQSLPSSPLVSIKITGLDPITSDTLHIIFPPSLRLPTWLRRISLLTTAGRPTTEMPTGAVALWRTDPAMRVFIEHPAQMASVRSNRALLSGLAHLRDGQDGAGRALLVEAAQGMLRWAHAHADELARTGDSGGLIELAQAMKPLRERLRIAEA